MPYLCGLWRFANAYYVNDKGGELSTILHEEWEDFMYGVTPTAEEALKKATERGNALLAE